MNSNPSTDFCADRRTGALLLPYGLHTLSDSDCTRFEEHILKCGACSHELSAVSDYLHTLYLQRMILVQHFHATGRSFEESVSRLVAEGQQIHA